MAGAISIVTTPFALASDFTDAISKCSRNGDNLIERAEDFGNDGWQKLTNADRYMSFVADALSVQNPPTRNSASDWDQLRAQMTPLAQYFLSQNEQTLLSKGSSIVELGTQLETNYPTCVVYSVSGLDENKLIERLEAAGGLNDWGYVYRGEMYARETANETAINRTEIVIYGTNSAKLPALEPPLSATIAATLVTKPVR
ncbi:MAG: hypothetical protein VX228_05400 [Pseudomonadota bacterium]|nr:hypothetical protein [Pseudomonadota bacterium]